MVPRPFRAFHQTLEPARVQHYSLNERRGQVSITRRNPTATSENINEMIDQVSWPQNRRSTGLRRIDRLVYDEDFYGETQDMTKMRKRKVSIAEFLAPTCEADIKNGLWIPTEIEFIKAGDKARRDAIIKIFKDAKLGTLPDGRTVESVVKI
jgi:hypothetical protein